MGVKKATNLYTDAFKRLRRNKPAMFGLAFVIFITIIAVLAPLLAPADPNKIDLQNRLKPMGSSSRICKNGVYLLGSDEYGRDILSRLIYGARVSLLVGVVTQFITTVIGIIVGALAGYYGGAIDMFMMRVADVLFAFPELLFYIGMMFALGPGLTNMFIALSVIGWAGKARLVRSQVMSLKETEFVEAAKAQGFSDFRIITKHILPNCMGPIIVSVSLGIPGSILAEAGLSFLGLGILPPTPSWGNMIRSASAYLRIQPWYAVWPGLVLMLATFSFNLLGDGLRDALDPRLKQ
ncbi:ABC transporter permease [Pseudothermotoga sp.]|uniref:ABC transporter permease n=1 Tax=Pseudothermotoga sp. TaxID=2033661 RepID=UPI0031F6ED87